MSLTSSKRPDNIPTSLNEYVKEEFPVEVIMELIEGSQDDVCETHSTLQFISRTETSIIWFSNDWVGPPKSVVEVVVDVDVNIGAIESYISVHCKNQWITSSRSAVVVGGGGGGGGGGLFVGGGGLLFADPKQTSPSGQHPARSPLLAIAQ